MDKKELKEQLKKAEKLHDLAGSGYRRERYAEACYYLRGKLNELEDEENDDD